MVARDMIFSAPPLVRCALVKNLVGTRYHCINTTSLCTRVEVCGEVGVVAEGVVRASAEEEEEGEGEETFLSAALIIPSSLPKFASSRHICGS
jgi:hypothetical protein